MSQRLAVWYGTDEALKALRKAVEHNCDCVPGETTCSAHEMLSDQDALNHLAFVMVNRMRYLHGEFDAMSEWF